MGCKPLLLLGPILIATLPAHPAHGRDGHFESGKVQFHDQLSSRCGEAPAKEGKVAIETHDVEVMFDRTQSINELSRIAGEDNRSGPDPYGLTTDGYEEGWHYGLATWPVTGGYCSRPVSIDARFFFRPMREYVAAELSEGSCEFDTVKAHEDAHIAIDRDAYEQYAPAYIEAARTALDGPSWPVFSEDKQTVMMMARGEINAVISPVIENFQKSRFERHSFLDSIPERQKANNRCGHWPLKRLY